MECGATNDGGSTGLHYMAGKQVESVYERLVAGRGFEPLTFGLT